MPILISNDERFSVWMHDITPPPQAVRACLWIEHDKDTGRNIPMEWTVEIKLNFKDRYEERLRGWGKTRHDAFVRLRQRLNDLRSIKIRA